MKRTDLKAAVDLENKILKIDESIENLNKAHDYSIQVKRSGTGRNHIESNFIESYIPFNTVKAMFLENLRMNKQILEKYLENLLNS